MEAEYRQSPGKRFFYPLFVSNFYIIQTAISPTWTQIGQLASIAVIRTFLNHFLEEDLEKYEVANERGGVSLDRAA